MVFGFGGKSFDPEKDIPALNGKIILVTGGNAGLGKEAIIQLAKHNPTRVYLAARTASKAEEAIADIKKVVPDANVTHLSLDLTSFASIKAAAEAVKGESDRLDILINNAGIMATPYSTTKEGYEIQFGTNHVGHALLTKLLLPLLLKTAALPDADVRIVNLSSEGHRGAPSGGIVFDQAALEQHWTGRRYGQSKLANILFTKGLAKRYPQITSVAVHPGVIITNLYTPISEVGWGMKPFIALAGVIGPILFSSVAAGAKNELWAATAPKDDVKSGEYYVPVAKHSNGTAYARDEALADKLWDWTEEEFAKHGY